MSETMQNGTEVATVVLCIRAFDWY